MQSGYDDNSPINHVNKLKGKFFLYTSGDDNVHVQLHANDGSLQTNKQFDSNLSRQ
jgi:dipeptidyl-peptidase-4